jgi:hypothetical protein
MLMSIIEKELKRILDGIIIVPLRYSDWVANLVPMRKKSGEICLCVDFQNLNKCSLKDNYPPTQDGPYPAKGNKCSQDFLSGWILWL